MAMHQAINFMVADMAPRSSCRLLVWQAAWMLDDGRGRGATLYSSFAKRFSADTVMKVTTDAVQVLRRYGYMKSTVEKLCATRSSSDLRGHVADPATRDRPEIFLPRGD